MKNKIFLILLLVAVNSTLILAQSAGKLYLSSAGTGVGRVYDITGNTPSTVQTTLPASITSPAYYNANNGASVSNLAIGYDTTVANQPLVFINSNTAANSPILKNGTATGLTLPAGGTIGGLGTNNVLGNNFGQVFGFSGKNLYRLYPTSSAVILITGDAIWNANGTGAAGSPVSTIFASDTFYDYQNNVYTILQHQNGTTFTRYLYKIAINGAVTSATATQIAQITGPVGVRNATTNTSTTTNVGNIRGSAYLNGFVFVSSGNGDNAVFIYRINISTGVSEYLAQYPLTGISLSNIDLASVDYFVPFTFNCGGTAFQGTTPYRAGTSSTRTLRIPVSDIYGPGNYLINVIGTDFTNPAHSVTVTTATTFIDVPITYNGTGAAGSRTLTVDLNGSTTTCTVTATIEPDTDIDGLANTVDLDDDNDGITDCTENGLAAASFLNNFTFVPNNNASGVSANIAQLTPNAGTQSGQYWSVGKVDFTKSFSFTFDAFVGEFDAGADGIAVVFQNSPAGTAAVGATGVGMGAQNIANGLVLELDTYDNGPGVGDIVADHGQIWDSDNQGAGLTTSVDLGQLENNAYHPVVVTWNAGTQTLSYTVDGITAGTLTTANFANTYFGASKVRFGFTASTGGSTNVHRIRINDFCSTPIELDTDNDGISNHLDTDSDGDSCPDAIEGSENVTYSMVNPLTSQTNPGQINVRFNGTTAGTPSQIISTATAANGVPQVVNNGANNSNASIGLVAGAAAAGVADNTGSSPVSGVGQAVGNSQNSALNDCKCYRNPTITLGTDNATIHGITAFNRAGVNNTNWPMIRNNGWTALEANTKAFVMNRMPAAATTAGAVIAGEPVNAALTAPVIAVPIVGMTFYDTTNNCMKINTDGTRTGWKCFNTQSCPEEN